MYQLKQYGKYLQRRVGFEKHNFLKQPQKRLVRIFKQIKPTDIAERKVDRAVDMLKIACSCYSYHYSSVSLSNYNLTTNDTAFDEVKRKERRMKGAQLK